MADMNQFTHRVQYDSVMRELQLSDMMNPPCMSVHGEEPHSYEWCHTPRTLFAIRSPGATDDTLEENHHMYLGKFMYPKKMNPVFLGNWVQSS